jgi:ppGpp synthetase/RelA/SpoT-type nucleotidyltranferase
MTSPSPIDPKKHAEQIVLYRDEQPIYERFRVILENRLKGICRRRGIMATTEARAKTIPSFAEKAARKWGKYKGTPLEHMTDLAGARLIVSTREEVDLICDDIRGQFDVDEKNSEDTSSRLRVDQFGYLSVHFVVRLKPDGDNPVAPEDLAKIGTRRAEIQVRTFLQHAWAQACHDRVYKTRLTLPEVYTREVNRLAATLEQADGTLGQVTRAIDSYAGAYVAYMTPEERKVERGVLSVVLENENEPVSRASLALRLARLIHAGGDHQGAVAQLADVKFEQLPPLLQLQIRFERGCCQCGHFAGSPDSDGFKRGQKDLIAALEWEESFPETGAKVGTLLVLPSSTASIFAAVHAKLAWSYALQDQSRLAREEYGKAINYDPSNPYNLADLIEHEILSTKNRSLAIPMSAAIRTARSTCVDHINVGIELPRAHFTLGRLAFFIEEWNVGLCHFAKLVHLCLQGQAFAPARFLGDVEKFLKHLSLPSDRTDPPAYVCLREMCEVVREVVQAREQPLRQDRPAPGEALQGPVVIIAGGTRLDLEKKMSHYEKILDTALQGFSGTVVSGGTVHGVAGILGTIAAKRRKEKANTFRAVGYIPEKLPSKTTRDDRYDKLVTTKGQDYGPEAPIACWRDIIRSGINPADVTVIGINGGEITAFELRWALALGAQVAVIKDSGRAAEEILADPSWRGSNDPQSPHTIRLLPIPEDAQSLVALLRENRKPAANSALIERIAPHIHENYCNRTRKNALKNNAEPALLRWEELSESMRQSNRSQAAFAVENLRQEGYEVRPLASGESYTPPLFSLAEVDRMAEREHGRFNAERIRDGWRHQPGDKDTVKKTSPYLIPWSELDPAIADYDRNAVREYPMVLRTADLGIFKRE